MGKIVKIRILTWNMMSEIVKEWFYLSCNY